MDVAGAAAIDGGGRIDFGAASAEAGELRVSGTIAPGRAGQTGAIDVIGSLSLSSSGRSEVRFSRTEPEIGFDVLRVLGAATLAGTIAVELLAPASDGAMGIGFLPSAGSSFDILTATTIVHQGFAMNLLELSEGFV